MNFQSQILISLILLTLIIWLFRNLAQHKLSSGQVVFWVVLLAGAEVFVLFPAITEWVSIFWGDLFPISWITFIGMAALISYLLYQSIHLNKVKIEVIELHRTLALLEKEFRDNKKS